MRLINTRALVSMTRQVVTAAVYACSFLALLAYALPSDREQPIHIVSNSADIDDAKGIAIYRGDVVMTQGSTELKGDVITIYSQNRAIKQVVSEGNKKTPAYYQEEQKNDKGLLKAWGLTIRYDVETETIELIKQARLVQKDDTFTGNQIKYDQTKQVVTAQGQQDPSGSGRVQMVIHPNQPSKKP